ncbi:MAG: TlpA family protein disulfide reductase, partial [Rhodobacterales bacterium]|nr:TlpA family protein disulfide reductase [Rhodobacterales bacterium]
LLNIWATWCPPCREEMPTLDRLQSRLGGADFAVLPLCIDDAGIGRGRRFYDEIGIVDLPLYWAEALRVQLALAFIGLPTTLLIDRQTREIGRLQGPYAWDSEDAVDQIVGAL